jgi:hypothetical protein
MMLQSTDRLQREPPKRAKEWEGKIPKLNAYWVVPLLLFLIVAFLAAFKLSSVLQQSRWNIQITLLVFFVAICFISADAFVQLRKEWEIWSKWRREYELADWTGDAGPLVKHCPLCDERGIYYTTYNQSRFLDLLLHQVCKPILIPWQKVKAVRWLSDRIRIQLQSGDVLAVGPSDELFSQAQKSMPPGTVSEETALE